MALKSVWREFVPVAILAVGTRTDSLFLDTHFSIAMANVAGTLGKSSEVMKLVNGLLKLPQLQTTMREMAQGKVLRVLVRSVWEAGVL